MAKAELVMLAHTYDSAKYSAAGWFMSQKLDGVRAVWDGGITCGMKTSEIPWANTEKDRKTTYSTGLWSRYAKVIYAPGWWTESLPRGVVLDGELWSGVGSFQETSSIIKRHVPNERWAKVKYMIFDSPGYESFLKDRVINTINYKKRIVGAESWLHDRKIKIVGRVHNSFEPILNQIHGILEGLPFCELHNQAQLPFNTRLAEESIYDELDRVTALGGEGLILRRAMSMWVPERSHDLLKVKKWLDSEGVIVGYKWGKETDKGSKLLDLMGSLRIRWTNTRGRTVEFDVSGFELPERQMEGPVGLPGSVASDEAWNPMFRRGARITFKYRELTDAGIPKEARYLRPGP